MDDTRPFRHRQYSQQSSMPHVSSLIAAYQRVPQNNEQKPVGTRPTNKNHPLREQILREQPFSIRENLKIDSPPERPSSIISVDISRLSSALSNRSSHGVPPLNLASSPNHHHNHNHNHNHNPNIWDFGSVRHLKQMSGRSSSEDSAVDSVFEVVTQSPQSSKSSYTYTSFLPELEDTSPHTGCHTSFLELDGDESKSLQRRTAITVSFWPLYVGATTNGLRSRQYRLPLKLSTPSMPWRQTTEY